MLKVEEDGSFSDYATGLTMLTDLRTGPDGNLFTPPSSASSPRPARRPRAARSSAPRKAATPRSWLLLVSFATSFGLQRRRRRACGRQRRGVSRLGQVTCFRPA
ncbi:MAG: hypothetical protein R3A10_20935 [Caldilineaceae bacterium]